VGVVGVAVPVVIIISKSFSTTPAGTATVGFTPVTTAPAPTNDIAITWS
jgi:hypothetical protein